MKYLRFSGIAAIFLLFVTAYFLPIHTHAQTNEITITIEKFADPELDTEFPFVISVNDGGTFTPLGTLSDPSNSSDTFNVVCNEIFEIRLGELIPSGWEFFQGSCTVERDGEFVFSCPLFKIIPGNDFRGFGCPCSDDIVCAFINQPIPEETCNLAVGIDAGGGNLEFLLNLSAGVLDENFELSHGDIEDFEELPLSTKYTVTEDVPNGIVLEDIVCEGDADFTQTRVDNSAQVTCNSQGNVTCTFINASLPRPITTLSQWGLIAMAGVLGIIGLIAIRRRAVT